MKEVQLLVSHKDATPLYLQVKTQLVQAIMNGHLEPHESLPSIRRLALQSETSVITIKRAYEELENEGWIYTRPGKGSFVDEVDKQKKRKHLMERYEQKLFIWSEEALNDGLSIDDVKDVIRRWEIVNKT